MRRRRGGGGEAAIEHRCLQGAPAMRGRERHLRGAGGGGEGRWKVIFYADKYWKGGGGRGWNSLVGRPLGGKVEESQHTALYNLPVVPDGAAQHHAEDHPYDHDSRHTDPDVSDDVELLVEEVCYCSETVRCILSSLCTKRSRFL